MQKLLTRTLRNTPTDTSQVRSNCGMSLNRDQSLSVASLKTVNNNPEENQSSGRTKQNLRVFVLNMRGKPLMPMTAGKAKRLLKVGKAKVVKRTPFTIQLAYATGETKQPVTLGVDPGYKNVGVSAVSDGKELFSSTVELRTDIVKLLSEKRQYRRTRRNRKWHRKPRFLNRGIKKDWLAPSVQHRLDLHIKIIGFVKSILPVSQINVEAAAFDIQKINNPDISGTDYQNGPQKEFWNVREYVFYRDNHTCRHCNGKSGDKRLHAHHIRHRSHGGTDMPDNLAALCVTCHDDYHAGRIELKLKGTKGFKAETVMSILRWKIVDRLRELGNKVNITYGYLTKMARIALGLEKTHRNDAFCIAGGTIQERTTVYAGKQARRNNRSIQLNRKGFKPSIRKVRYRFQPMDLVRIAKKVCFVSGVQNLGKYIKLKELKKPVKTESVQLIKYGKGLQYV
ncbi:MAG: RNA-guided endonuclease IscB [bacterium]